MRLILNGSLFLIILSTFFFSCEKELSLENNIALDTAVFSFSGAPQACNNAVVSGNYQVGTVLDAGNIVTLSVEVSAPGAYEITTSTINGISFAASGLFATAGPQTVQLIGVGTPIAAGTFDFVPGTNGCVFSIPVSAGGGGGTALFTYGGAPGGCTNAAVTGVFAAGTALSGTNTVTIGVDVTTVGTYNITTPVVNGFSFAGSGSFTTTGPQTVILVGNGTPTAAGLSNFTLSNNGCSFPITVDDAVVVTDFIKCTIDGVARTFNVSAYAEQPDSSAFQVIGAETTVSSPPIFTIELTKSPAITTGDYERPTLSNLETFCLAAYSDGVSATSWAIGLAGQAGGFTVTVTSLTSTRIEGTFSGTLYGNDGQGTDAKVVTLGEFSLPY